MNPMTMMQLMQRWSLFQQDHPKVIPFLQAAKDIALQEGAVLEIKATDPEGKAITSNIRVTANDVETFRMVSELSQRPE